MLLGVTHTLKLWRRILRHLGLPGQRISGGELERTVDPILLAAGENLCGFGLRVTIGFGILKPYHVWFFSEKIKNKKL